MFKTSITNNMVVEDRIELLTARINADADEIRRLHPGMVVSVVMGWPT